MLSLSISLEILNRKEMWKSEKFLLPYLFFLFRTTLSPLSAVRLEQFHFSKPAVSASCHAAGSNGEAVSRIRCWMSCRWFRFQRVQTDFLLNFYSCFTESLHWFSILSLPPAKAEKESNYENKMPHGMSLHSWTGCSPHVWMFGREHRPG